MNWSPRRKTVISSCMSCLEIKFTTFLSEPMRPRGFSTVVSTLWIPEGRVRECLPPPFALENPPYICGRERYHTWLVDMDDTRSLSLVAGMSDYIAYTRLLSRNFGVLDSLFVNVEDFVSPTDYVTPAHCDVDRTDLAVSSVGSNNLINSGRGDSLVGQGKNYNYITPQI